MQALGALSLQLISKSNAPHLTLFGLPIPSELKVWVQQDALASRHPALNPLIAFGSNLDIWYCTYFEESKLNLCTQLSEASAVSDPASGVEGPADATAAGSFRNVWIGRDPLGGMRPLSRDPFSLRCSFFHQSSVTVERCSWKHPSFHALHQMPMLPPSSLRLSFELLCDVSWALFTKDLHLKRMLQQLKRP